MAYLNLLAGNVRGTLGSTYSARYRGGIALKARPFSKAPLTLSQKNNVRSFECLNRLSSKFAKKTWDYLGLSDKTMLKHNAVSKFFKPMILSHYFEPINLSNLIDPSNIISYDSIIIDQSTGSGSFGYFVNDEEPLAPDERLLLAVFNEKGETFYCEALTTLSGSIMYFGNFPNNSYIYIMGFRSLIKDGKRKLQDFNLYTIYLDEDV